MTSWLSMSLSAPRQASAGFEHLRSAEHRRDFAVLATVGHVSVSPDKAAARRRAKPRSQAADPFDYRFQSGHDEWDEASPPILAGQRSGHQPPQRAGACARVLTGDAACRCTQRFPSPMSSEARVFLFASPLHLSGTHPKMSISAARRPSRCLPRQLPSRFRSRHLARRRIRPRPDNFQTKAAPRPLRLKMRKRRMTTQTEVIRRRPGLPSSISCHNIGVEELSTCSYESVLTFLLSSQLTGARKGLRKRGSRRIGACWCHHAIYVHPRPPCLLRGPAELSHS